MSDAHFEYPSETYRYAALPTETSLRVLELFPGAAQDPVRCSLHITQWPDSPQYEAVSYTWGDPNVRLPIVCDGKRIEVTVNLHDALTHFRYPDRRRFLWADSLCTDQSNIPERGCQVNQMWRIYKSARGVLTWLGKDTQDGWAKASVGLVRQFSDFICDRLQIEVSDLRKIDDIYQEVVFENRRKLPLPNECDFVTEDAWPSLVWLYSHRYFTRVWVIQELSANPTRLLHCGHEIIEWERVCLVAGYFMMETAWSKEYGFSDSYIWWVATMSTEIRKSGANWLHMLYLASNFSCTDQRDNVFGLLGLMRVSEGAELLRPNYSIPPEQVYRNSVEAALVNFKKTDVLVYTAGNAYESGNDLPSWVPQWNRPMLFRNPFRFGKPMPWRPAGDTDAIWKVDRANNLLSISGCTVDRIKLVEPYYDTYFGNAMARSNEGKGQLRQIWTRILQTIATGVSQRPISATTLTAAAVSLSFGLDEDTNPAEGRYLLLNFVAYLRDHLATETFRELVPPELADEAKNAKGQAFGKPIWDFDYPESTLFITEGRLIGCATSRDRPGDLVCIPLGSTYPLVLRPQGNHFVVRGFAYVHGIMFGEVHGLEERTFEII